MDLSSAKVYWQFLDPYIKDKGVVKVFPDGVFRFINFNSLLMKNGKYLISQKNVRILNSYQSLLNLGNQDEKIVEENNSAFFFGAPDFNTNVTSDNKSRSRMNSSPEESDTIVLKELPETENEIRHSEKILKSYNWTTKIYLKKAASKDNLLKVNSPKVLHIATHGYYEPIKSDLMDIESILTNCGLFLSNPNDNNVEMDGKITALEIRNLNLHKTELVVLSACVTGLGYDMNTGDYLGLQSAFFNAGVRTIIVSLWEVDDNATRELMTSFYSNLAKSGNIISAFRDAQLEIMNQYPQPFYWAGFLIIER